MGKKRITKKEEICFNSSSELHNYEEENIIVKNQVDISNYLNVLLEEYSLQGENKSINNIQELNESQKTSICEGVQSCENKKETEKEGGDVEKNDLLASSDCADLSSFEYNAQSNDTNSNDLYSVRTDDYYFDSTESVYSWSVNENGEFRLKETDVSKKGKTYFKKDCEEKQQSELLIEFEKLENEKNWQEIILLAEQKLESENKEDAYIAKLWWVMGQVYAASMPVSILAGPLEEVSKKVIERQKKTSRSVLLLTERALLLLAKTLGVEDFEMTNLFLLRATKINSDNIGLYLDSLKSELAKLQSLPQTKDVEKKIEEIKKKISETCEAYSFHLNGDERCPSPEIPLKKNEVETQIERKKQHFSLFNFVVLIVALTCVFLGGDYFFNYIGAIEKFVFANETKKVVFHSEVFLSTKLPYSGYILSKYSVIKPTKNNSSLEGLLDKLSEKKNPTENDVNPVVTSVVEKSVEKESLRKDQGEASESHIAKRTQAKNRVVNTNYPLEPEDVRAIIEKGREEESDDKEKDKKVDKVTKPIVAGHDLSNPIVPAYVKPKKDFLLDEGTLYYIRENTEVFSSPRLSATVVSFLRFADRVKVSSIRRNWAKIVSNNGNIGYIKKHALGSRVQENDDFVQE